MPGLRRVDAFGSDFPHPEAGGDPIASFARELSPPGGDVGRMFMRDNGRFLVARR